MEICSDLSPDWCKCGSFKTVGIFGWRLRTRPVAAADLEGKTDTLDSGSKGGSERPKEFSPPPDGGRAGSGNEPNTWGHEVGAGGSAKLLASLITSLTVLGLGFLIYKLGATGPSQASN